MLFSIYGMSSFPLTLIFFRGVGQPPTSDFSTKRFGRHGIKGMDFFGNMGVKKERVLPAKLSGMKVEPMFFWATKPYRPHAPQELVEEYGKAEIMKFIVSRQAVFKVPVGWWIVLGIILPISSISTWLYWGLWYMIIIPAGCLSNPRFQRLQCSSLISYRKSQWFCISLRVQFP